MPNGAFLPEMRLGGAYRVNSNEYNPEPSGDLPQEDKTLCFTPDHPKTTNLVRYHSCDTFFLVKEPAKIFNDDQRTCSKTASLHFIDGLCRPLPLGNSVQVGKNNRDYMWRDNPNQSRDSLPMVTKTAGATLSADGSCASYNISPGLLRLFQSSVFSIDMALKYLFDKDDIYIQAYLAQRLFEFPSQEVDFYLLQLVSLYHSSQALAKHLFPYFLYRCARSIEFSVHLIWLLDTFSPCLRRECSLRRTVSSLLQCRPLNDQLIGQLIAADVGVCGSLTHSDSDAAFRVARLPREEQEGLVADSGRMPRTLATAVAMATEGSQLDTVSNPVECLRSTLLPIGDHQLLGILQMAAQRNASDWQATCCSSHTGNHHRHHQFHESNVAIASLEETGSYAGGLKRSTIPGALPCSHLGLQTLCRHKRAVSDLTNLASYPRYPARVLSTDLASHCLSANGGQGRGDNLLPASANQVGLVMIQPQSLSSLLSSRDSAVGLSRDNDVGRAKTSAVVGPPPGRNRNEEGHSDSDQSTGVGDNRLRRDSFPQQQPSIESAVTSTDSKNGSLILSFTSPLTLDDSFVKEEETVEPKGSLANNPTETSTSSPSDSGLNMVITSNTTGSDDLATPVGEASQAMPQGHPRTADDTTTTGDWLSADRRLDMQVHLVPRILPQWEFVDGLMRLARRLLPIASKEQRTAYLQAELANINSNLPARVWLPVNKADHVVLRIPPTAAVCLNSKDKAPFMVYCEVLDCQDPWSISLPHRSTNGSLRLRRDTHDQVVGNSNNNTTTTTTTSLTSLSCAVANDWQSPTSSHSSGPESIVEPEAVSLTSSTESATAANEPHHHNSVISSGTLPKCSNPGAPRLQLHDGTVILSSRDERLGSSTGQSHSELNQEDVKQQQATDSTNTGPTTPIIYVSAGDIWNRLKQLSDHQLHRSFKTDPEDPSAAVLKEPWTVKCERIRSHSPWGHLPGWRLTAAIVKVGDDLRQEQLAYQLLNLLQRIWAAEYIPLWLRPLTVVVTSADSGLIEPVPDTVSLHQIHRHARLSLLDYLFREHGSANSEAFLEAQKNFVHSCAAYCLVGYLLQVKDRHNGNILLDSEGHMIHIDYGFILSASPGKNLGFEKSPFKLTQEQVAVMGGANSDLFEYFKCLLLKGLLAARKHMDDICLLVEIASTTCPGLPCFASGGHDTISRLRQRFMRTRVESTVQQRVNAMVEESLHSVTTKLYDSFQYYTNGIQY